MTAITNSSLSQVQPYLEEEKKNKEFGESHESYLSALINYYENPSAENAEVLARAALDFAQEVQGSDLSPRKKEEVIGALQTDMFAVAGSDGGVSHPLLRLTAASLESPEMLNNFEKMKNIEEAMQDYKNGNITLDEFEVIVEANRLDIEVGESAVNDQKWPWDFRQESREQASGFIDNFFSDFEVSVDTFLEAEKSKSSSSNSNIDFSSLPLFQSFGEVLDNRFIRSDPFGPAAMLLRAMEEFVMAVGKIKANADEIIDGKVDLEDAGKKLIETAKEFSMFLSGGMIEGIDPAEQAGIMKSLIESLLEMAAELGSIPGAESSAFYLRQSVEFLQDPVVLKNMEASGKIHAATAQVANGEMSVEEFTELYNQLVEEGFDPDYDTWAMVHGGDPEAFSELSQAEQEGRGMAAGQFMFEAVYADEIAQRIMNGDLTADG